MATFGKQLVASSAQPGRGFACSLALVLSLLVGGGPGVVTLGLGGAPVGELDEDAAERAEGSGSEFELSSGSGEPPGEDSCEHSTANTTSNWLDSPLFASVDVLAGGIATVPKFSLGGVNARGPPRS